MATPLADAHVEAQQRTRLLAAAAIARAWESLEGHDEDDVPVFLAIAVPLVLAAQRQAVALADAYLARAVGRRPLGVALDQLRLRGGVSPEAVYRRPFVETWSALRDGARWEDAVARGRARAESAAQMDVQLAHRDAVAEVTARDPRIVGFRRVTDGDACALCRIAATQRYHKGDLLPVHSHCGCSVEPLIGTEDPGRVIDSEGLADLKRSGVAGDLSIQQAAKRARERAEDNRERAAEWAQQLRDESDPARRRRLARRVERYNARAAGQDKLADEYRAKLAARRVARATQTAVAVAEHGELGPVLVNAAHNFKGAPDA